MKNIINLIVLGILFFTDLSGQKPASLKLWYDKPAQQWVEALPVGNGRIAAMVFGTPEKERLQLNEGTVWAGSPSRNDNFHYKDSLPKIRRLIFEGKKEEAQAVLDQTQALQKNYGMPYQTVGNLFLSFKGHEKYSDFYRELDIERAVSSSSYKVNGVTYKREVFASFPDQVIVVRLTADKPSQLNFTAWMNSPQNSKVNAKEKDKLVLSGTTSDHEGVKGMLQFQAHVKVVLDGGNTISNDTSLIINNANTATLYISMATNFVNYADISADPEKRAVNYLTTALQKKYSTALADHTAAYQKYFNRVKIDLGVTDSLKKPTNVRVREFSKGYDPQLASLYFQFGRYLLISCSQPGGQPATLQGLWNDQLFPPWDSKYTVNINTEMNYWPAEVTNLTELVDPLVKMLQDLSVTGRQTAKIMYNADGWVLHHNTDLWRITGPVDRAYAGMWPSGGAWLNQNLWEKYLYNGDLNYLKSIYPEMKGAAEFFASAVIEEPEHKWLVICPSNSPENTHVKGKRISTAAGVTMDNQLMFDLFSNVITASELLNTDKEFAQKLKQVRDRLAPMQIGQHSQLQEWMHDWDDPKDIHRHVSHLYGVYPSNQISPYRTPELFDAARTSLIYRGDVSTGWSMGWKVNLWARFLDGNHAYKLLTDQLKLVGDTSTHVRGGGTYANLFDAHPPFQIDGNFGCTAGIAEMFVQSHDAAIHILPALPDVWKNGSITGLRARGGFEIISLEWKNGEVSKLVLKSTLGGNCRLRVHGSLASKDVTLAEAKGKNPNPFYQTPEIKAPLISPKAKLNKVDVKPSAVYEFNSTAGKVYTFTGL